MPIADFVTINLGPMEPSPITAAMSLDRFGTVAFGVEVMREHIHYGEVPSDKPWHYRQGRYTVRGLDIAPWFWGVVPEVYRQRVDEITRRVFNDEFLGRLMTREVLEHFVHRLSAVIANEIEPIYPEVP